MTADEKDYVLEHAETLVTIAGLTENCDESRWMADAFRECADARLSARAEADVLRALLSASQTVQYEGGWPVPHEPGWWWHQYAPEDPLERRPPMPAFVHRICGDLVVLYFGGSRPALVSDQPRSSWGPRIVEWTP